MVISFFICSMILGRWIFTATRVPSCSVAWWTWAIEADATGTSLNFRNISPRGRFSSCSISFLIDSKLSCGTASCNFDSSFAISSPTISGRVLNICPNLMNVVPNSSKTSRILSGAEASNSSKKSFERINLLKLFLRPVFFRISINSYLAKIANYFFKSLKIKFSTSELPKVHYIIYHV
jgi:hypothetical protein